MEFRLWNSIILFKKCNIILQFNYKSQHKQEKSDTPLKLRYYTQNISKRNQSQHWHQPHQTLPICLLCLLVLGQEQYKYVFSLYHWILKRCNSNRDIVICQSPPSLELPHHLVQFFLITLYKQYPPPPEPDKSQAQPCQSTIGIK